MALAGACKLVGEIAAWCAIRLLRLAAQLMARGIATLLASTNTRGWSQETLKGAIQMHLNLLLQEATAQLKKDWSGSIAAYDESQHQAMQMADMLSDGIIKQFPSRFTNKATAVSSR